MKMWTKEMVELLLIKYKEHDNLYNVRDPMYIDRGKRSDSLIDICNELKEINKNVTVEGIRKKIHTLRSQYRKESRELANSRQIGVAYEPKLWCFAQLEFLKSHCGQKKPAPIYSETDDDKTGIVLEEESIGVTSESQAQHSNTRENVWTNWKPTKSIHRKLPSRASGHRRRNGDRHLETQNNFFANEEKRAAERHRWEEDIAKKKLELINLKIEREKKEIEKLNSF